MRVGLLAGVEEGRLGAGSFLLCWFEEALCVVSLRKGYGGRFGLACGETGFSRGGHPGSERESKRRAKGLIFLVPQGAICCSLLVFLVDRLKFLGFLGSFKSCMTIDMAPLF